MRKYAIVNSILFFLIVFSPGFMKGARLLHLITKDFHGSSLSGYFESHERPSFSKHSYATRDYQKDFEAWLNSHVSLRAFYIRIYNQIQFTLFKLSNRIIGKNDDIFEMIYINAECGLVPGCNFDNPKNYKKLKEYVRHLENVQNKLQKIGKQFLFYTTPSKATQHFNNIPLKYRLKKQSDYITPYYYLKELLSNTSINYIDSRDFLSTDGTPDFYNTGIHWARPIEQRVSQAIVENLSERSNKKLPRIVLGELKSSDLPIKRDADVYNLVNMIQNPHGAYYEYEAQVKAECESLPNFLIQGGSFAEGFYVFDYAGYTKQSYKFFYGRELRNNDGTKTEIKKWKEMPFEEILDNVDYVIVELNESVIHKFSNGFVKYLDSFLNSYRPKNIKSKEIK